jgi:glycoprotein endo-alpha-1,2-mannosidase
MGGTLDRMRKLAVRSFALLALAACLFALKGGESAVPDDHYVVGAHYYVWYPANFAQGYLRGALSPPERPALGEYDSRSAGVAERHIDLAASHGIDFFAIDWWPDRPAQNAAIDEGFLRAANLDRIRFCLTYDSLGLGDRNDAQGILFDEPTKRRFVADMVTIARRYFGHPRYLRVDGRPVVVIYLTREMRGLVGAAMRETRESLAALGYDPFLIGDEIFWGVIQANEDPRAAAKVSSKPQIARARLFDAITSYNLYQEIQLGHRGYPATSAFLVDSEALYRRYREVAGVPIVPGVIPGFNDRGTRLDADHFAIPRRWSADAPEGSLFAQQIDRIAKPYADKHLRMVLITSWNEWNEDTAIEPVAPAPRSREDGRQQRITQGYDYEGYATTYLDIVKKELGGS